MTTKDYVRIARALNVAFRQVNQDDGNVVYFAANLIADELKADNHLFDRERFLAAVEAP